RGRAARPRGSVPRPGWWARSSGRRGGRSSARAGAREPERVELDPRDALGVGGIDRGDAGPVMAGSLPQRLEAQDVEREREVHHVAGVSLAAVVIDLPPAGEQDDPATAERVFDDTAAVVALAS